MNIVVVGAGAWGTAFALHLSRLGHTVTLAPRRFEQALAIASTRENADYLPGFKLPQSIQVGHELVLISYIHRKLDNAAVQSSSP
jgi:glycerol-3-phosphate dehydrogenase (NAD(P)+)